MHGWTSKGILKGQIATYRIEESDHGFYLFIFKGDKQYPEIDELQNTLQIAQSSAERNWGSNGDWIEESWEKSYS